MVIKMRGGAKRIINSTYGPDGWTVLAVSADVFARMYMNTCMRDAAEGREEDAQN